MILKKTHFVSFRKCLLERIFTWRVGEVNETEVASAGEPAAAVPDIVKTKSPERVRASCEPCALLPVERRGGVVLGDNFLGVVGQSLRLRQKFKTLYHFRIGLGANFHALILTEGIDKNFRLDVRLNPVVVVEELGLGVGN